MTTEHRKAPRRKIIKVEKAGDWGSVSHIHLLACGHKEERPRKSSTKSLACVMCLKANQAEEKIKQISSTVPSMYEDEEDFYQESKLSSIKASLSLNLNVPIDSVDIVTNYVDGYLQIQYAVVFISPADIERITSQEING